MDPLRYTLVVVLAAASCGLSSMKALGAQVATEAQLDAMVAQHGEKWMAKPDEYLGEITGYMVRPGRKPIDGLVDQCERILEIAVDPAVTAAAHCIIAQTYYWDGLAKTRDAHDRSYFVAATEPAVKHYLLAWQKLAIPGRQLSRKEFKILSTAVQGLAVSIQSKSQADALSPETRADIKSQYLEFFTTLDDSDVQLSTFSIQNWPAEQRVNFLKHLGYADQLHAQIPEELPTKYPELVQILADNVDIDPLACGEIATILSVHFPRRLHRDPATVENVARVFYATDPATALAFLQDMARSRPEYLLIAYRHQVTDGSDQGLKLLHDFIRRGGNEQRTTFAVEAMRAALRSRQFQHVTELAQYDGLPADSVAITYYTLLARKSLGSEIPHHDLAAFAALKPNSPAESRMQENAARIFQQSAHQE